MQGKKQQRGSSRGGSRPGAGRQPNSGGYGETTQVIRVPSSTLGVVKDFLKEYQARNKMGRALAKAEVYFPDPDALRQATPLFSHKVPAGFPSPADDYIEATLDLNEYLVPHQETSFFVKVKGHSMTGAGIFDGDMLVVDRSIEPTPGKIIVAVVDGELTVKRLAFENGLPILKAQNPHFKDIVLKDTQELLCWGVVTSTIRKID